MSNSLRLIGQLGLGIILVRKSGLSIPSTVSLSFSQIAPVSSSVFRGGSPVSSKAFCLLTGLVQEHLEKPKQTLVTNSLLSPLCSGSWGACQTAFRMQAQLKTCSHLYTEAILK